MATDSFQREKPVEIVQTENLRPAELSAITFHVGCCEVRWSERIYRGFTDETADEQEVEQFKAGLSDEEFPCILGERFWVGELQRVQEISARLIDQPDSPFVYVCKTKNSHGYKFFEEVSAIYSIKENPAVPDEYASLFVRIDYSGMDYGSDDWYRLSPTGKVTSLRSNGYGQRSTDAKFR